MSVLRPVPRIPRRSSISESEDITNAIFREAGLTTATSTPQLDCAQRSEDSGTGGLPCKEKSQNQLDVVEKFFLNSQRPTVALFAISICLVGVMDFLPKTTHDPQTWTEDVDSVSGFYGPGVIISWCLMSMSMLLHLSNLRTRSAPPHGLLHPESAPPQQLTDAICSTSRLLHPESAPPQQLTDAICSTSRLLHPVCSISATYGRNPLHLESAPQQLYGRNTDAVCSTSNLLHLSNLRTQSAPP
ncbi:uncharacterized protein M421DRAFT_222923 [Didymella exigua CBS 183.55]|uniref:Uncharacterized protein n=1 Tax=Didymella exigua CBS 183.55 TaxID=1150837 RepID=A0A6A5RFR9_9PLEO|nr:uncharacterized protein M421DRAFT_222923 [Didymella exigua CBS 183.55]KAF1926323.1 hypothetical protein M421DRAFT_222923 [Didymella exigua CBS 183.55]